MDVYKDIIYLRETRSSPLIPCLMKTEKAYNIGYVMVSFAEEEYDDKSIIESIDTVGIRKGETIQILNVEYPNVPIVLDFGEEKMNLYYEHSADYCDLIDNEQYEKALELFDKIACNDLKRLFESIFDGQI